VADGTRAVVMVVDDDATWRELLLDFLKDERFQVAGAANGAEALRRLVRGEVKPDLILLDLDMPVMDGWRFRRRQLADERLAAIPVVVVSSDEPGSLPVDGLVPKPCRPGELLSAVTGVLRRRRAA
jgi:CheY-like chemotaxis protein